MWAPWSGGVGWTVRIGLIWLIRWGMTWPHDG
jgi:hypothetical protein